MLVRVYALAAADSLNFFVFFFFLQYDTLCCCYSNMLLHLTYFVICQASEVGAAVEVGPADLRARYNVTDLGDPSLNNSQVCMFCMYVCVCLCLCANTANTGMPANY